MLQIFKNSKFPKILILHKKVEINSDGNIYNLFTERLLLEILDYNDELLKTKIVYDIHIKQIKITQQQNGLFYPWTSEKIFLIVDRIEKNPLDTLNVDAGYFSLKLDNDGLNIVISYTGLPDFLGVFGSFFATFTLFASLITSFPADLIYNQTLMNEIFKFAQNKKFKDKKQKIDLEPEDIALNANSFKFMTFQDLNFLKLNQILKKNLQSDKTHFKPENDQPSEDYKKLEIINENYLNNSITSAKKESFLNLIDDKKLNNKKLDQIKKNNIQSKKRDFQLEMINLNKDSLSSR